MSERTHAEALFLAHLPWIERVAAMACRRSGLWGADAEDATAWVKMRLMEDDYAALRGFRGESAPRTFLTAVVIRQFTAWQRGQRGRWRPSAAAERLGSPARDLEALVHREGYTLRQAGEKLRTSGRTDLSDIELARLLERLPSRMPLRPVSVPAPALLDALPADARADARVEAEEAAGRRGAVMGALGRAMDQLEPEERMILRMHLADGYTVADVARALRLEQKPLYRRVDRLRSRVRALLEHAGVRPADVRALPWEGDAP